MVVKFPRRGDVFWVNLDPTVGSEIQKTRPAVIISNDYQNQYSSLVIIAPITSKIHKTLPFDVPVEIGGKEGRILLDQVRSIDKKRLSKLMAMCGATTMQQVDETLKIVLDLK